VEHVCGASSAEQALALMGTRNFDVILCDYRMDPMDGLEFLERLRTSGDQTPVLLISGAPDKTGVIRAATCNADFLAKPVRIRELLAAINGSANKTLVADL